MRAKRFPIILASTLLLASCGPGQQALDEWKKLCDSEAGAQITRTVPNVDGFIFERVSRHHSVPWNSIEIFQEIYVGQYLRFRHYKFVEFYVPKDGIYDGRHRRLDFPTGNYRVTLEHKDHPNCRKPEALGILGPKLHANECFAISPVSKLTARYKLVQLSSATAYKDRYLGSYKIRVVDNLNGAVLAKFARHSISWTGLNIFFPIAGSSESKSCPSRAPSLNVRTVLHPVDVSL